ncbi:MAG: S8 family serine peptidase, partial [bacterium]
METMGRRRGSTCTACLGRLGMLGIAVLVVFWMGVWMPGAHPADAQVRFRSGPVSSEAKTAQEIQEVITMLAARPDQRHLVVQFRGPVKAEQKKALKQAGLQLLSYLGNNAFFASLTLPGVAPQAMARIPGLVDARAVDRGWKLHPAVGARIIPDHAILGKGDSENPTVAVYLIFHRDVDLGTTGVNIARTHGAAIADRLESINGLVVELPWACITALADEDAVQWIEWPLPRLSEVNDGNREITEADIVQALPYDLDGSGITVLVYDGGTGRSSHVDFQGRLAVRDLSGMADHATHVCGTIGGAGVANPTYKGIAPGVRIESYGFQYDGTGIFLYSNPGDIESDYAEAINMYGADISNNSIGTNTEPNGFDCDIQGDYGVTSALIDAIVRGSLGNPFRIIWANGNERQGSRCDVEGYGDYYSTAPPAGAKNHITVGALNSNDDSMTYFSSWGPVDDGRIKPDISAPGCQIGGDGGVTSCSSLGDTAYTVKCGTSMASPTVCGLSALLLQDFRARFPDKPSFRNSTLKILLAHNAVDLGTIGPDYRFGYGSVRIQKTIDFMRTGNFIEDQVDQDGTFSAVVLVNPGDSELKVTMAWDDVPGTPNVSAALVNDLDLRVFSPSSTRHYPWTLDPYNPDSPAVRTQADHVNNIEQVYVENPASGVWQIEVHGHDVPQGPQPFSLCASPGLIACSSAGVIALDASRYACSATVAIEVIDRDLNMDSGTVETVAVTVTSDSEPGGEMVELTETAAGTAEFRGTLDVAVEGGAGILVVVGGDTIIATYIDDDNGQGGQGIPVIATAIVDCTPPVISNVQTAAIATHTATVTFDTDEPACGTVRYGLSCGNLTETAPESGFPTAHAINLMGLQHNTSYFYALDARDEAGNAVSDDNHGVCYTFTTHDIPDCFTEIFVDPFDNDLDCLSLTFTPDGSYDYYSGCVEAIADLPIDPGGGTILSLSDDSYRSVNLLNGKTVSLYGTRYGTFYVGSNGYITFTGGDGDYTESLADH